MHLSCGDVVGVRPDCRRPIPDPEFRPSGVAPLPATGRI
ncbi:hypothetical protein D516_0728 [Rhodobacter sp. AKP1]|nr:Hypothetical Protein RSKD131_2570 [Cereibacter sphaeroides KD131]EKX58245.1 hypothetical protein D516_0728 [Rhodobacter sp. AKP1]